MKIDVTCKICHKPLTVEVDNAYIALKRDPYKLIPMATCNRCFDLRVQRRQLEEAIEKTCMSVEFAHADQEKSVRAKAWDTLTKNTQKYSKVIQAQMGLIGYPWESSLVDALLATPKRWSKTLQDFRLCIRRAHTTSRNQPPDLMGVCK